MKGFSGKRNETTEDHADDYDVRMHDPSTGSKDGFGAYRTWSHDGVGGALDFTVVNYNVAPDVNMDYTILNWSGTVDCVVQEADAAYEGLIGPGLNDLGTFTLATDEFLEIHEFQVGAAAVGLGVTVSVESVSGTADLDVRLFGDTQDYANKLSAIATAATAGPSEIEVLGPVIFTSADYQAVVDPVDTRATQYAVGKDGVFSEVLQTRVMK